MTTPCPLRPWVCRTALLLSPLACAMLLLPWPGPARAMTTLEPPLATPPGDASPHVRQGEAPDQTPEIRPGLQGGPVIQKDKDGGITITVPDPAPKNQKQD